MSCARLNDGNTFFADRIFDTTVEATKKWITYRNEGNVTRAEYVDSGFASTSNAADFMGNFTASSIRGFGDKAKNNWIFIFGQV